MKHTNKSHLREFTVTDRTLFNMEQECAVFMTHRKQTDDISFTHGKQREAKRLDEALIYKTGKACP